MKQKYTNLCILLLFALTISSCKKEFDQNPIDQNLLKESIKDYKSKFHEKDYQNNLLIPSMIRCKSFGTHHGKMLPKL